MKLLKLFVNFVTLLLTGFFHAITYPYYLLLKISIAL